MQLETFQVDQRNFFSCMKVKIFFEKLGKCYKRFNKPKHSQGLFFRFCADYLPIKSTNKDKIKSSSGRTCTTGDQRHAGQGYHQGSNSLQG